MRLKMVVEMEIGILGMVVRFFGQLMFCITLGFLMAKFCTIYTALFSACVCVCVCVRERERERERMCVYVY